MERDCRGKENLLMESVFGVALRRRGDVLHIMKSKSFTKAVVVELMRSNRLIPL